MLQVDGSVPSDSVMVTWNYCGKFRAFSSLVVLSRFFVSLIFLDHARTSGEKRGSRVRRENYLRGEIKIR